MEDGPGRPAPCFTSVCQLSLADEFRPDWVRHLPSEEIFGGGGGGAGVSRPMCVCVSPWSGA